MADEQVQLSDLPERSTQGPSLPTIPLKKRTTGLSDIPASPKTTTAVTPTAKEYKAWVMPDGAKRYFPAEMSKEQVRAEVNKGFRTTNPTHPAGQKTPHENFWSPEAKAKPEQKLFREHPSSLMYKGIRQREGEANVIGRQTFVSGSAEDAIKVIHSIASPTNAVLAGASFIPVVGPLVAIGAAGYYGIKGVVDLHKELSQGRAPNETTADHYQNMLLSASQIVSSLSGVAATSRGIVSRAVTKRFGIGPDLADKVVSQAKELKAGEVNANRVVAQTAQAVMQEKVRVSAPFEAIENKLSGAVSTREEIEGIVEKAAKDHGVNTSEIPAAVYRALPEKAGSNARALNVSENQTAVAVAREMQRGMSQRDARSMTSNLGYAPDRVEAIMNVAQGGSSGPDVTFRTLRRVDEDLYNAAQSAKDSDLRVSLTEASETVSKMRDKIAEERGQGKEYRKAKYDYMRFKRGVGGDLMGKWLNATTEEDQALAPRIADATTRETAEVLRSMLEQLGVNPEPLDRLAELQERQKGAIVPSKTPKQLSGKSSAELSQMRVDALMRGLQSRGFSNPGALIMTIYGLTHLAMGSPWGLVQMGYGISRGELPELMKSQRFQDFVLQNAGIDPASRQAASMRRAMQTISPVLGRIAERSKPKKDQLSEIPSR